MKRLTNLTMTPDKTRRIETGIDICVRSDILLLDDVSGWLGVKPTSGFEKGDAYVGREKRGSDIVTVDRVRPFGVWHFCTSKLSRSNSVEEHAKLFIDSLSPSRAAIARLIANPDFYVKISIWVVGYTFDVSSTVLAELAGLAEDFTVSCWEEEEENES